MGTPITINVKNIHLHAPESGAIPGFRLLSLPEILAAAKKPKESRYLGDGKEITPAQAEKELAALGPDWDMEEAHDLIDEISYDYKNQHGAYSRDESIKPGYHWTKTKRLEGGRVVVGFVYGLVYDSDGGGRCLARAVRVARQ
ncbi:hypothetical protein [Solilutibacter silvestris]|uniref:hypothetical protein n=1 Tax=Solilutibacter silvestris TaxID=1645665 RepID=UPI003D340923